MRSAIIANDGLWRCLCPRFEYATPRLRRMPARQLILPKFTTRSLAYNAALCGIASSTSPKNPRKNPSNPSKSRDSSSTSIPDPNDFAQWQRLLLGTELPQPRILHKAPKKYIESAIDTLCKGGAGYLQHHGPSRSTRVTELVAHLLRARKQSLTVEIYDAMIACMSETSGHSNFVRRLLKEMRLAQIPASKGVYDSALEALANHPNHVLSAEILDMMLASDMEIDIGTNQRLLLGLLRDGQHELAYSRLTQLRDKGEVVEAWIYTVFVAEFASQGYIDEALDLLQARRAVAEDDGYHSLVFYLLDTSASHFHFAGTCTMWEQIGADARSSLPDGILENIMGTAARHGNMELATSVLDIISTRQRTHGFHYEIVAEAQLCSKDIVGAMRVYSVMHQADLPVTESTVAQFRKLLLNEHELLEASEVSLSELRQERLIPPALVAAIVEAKAKNSSGEDASDLYNRMLELTGAEAGPALTQDMICLSTTRAEQLRFAHLYATRFKHATQDPLRPAAKLSKLISKLVELGEFDLALRLAEPQLANPEQLRHHGEWVEGIVEVAVLREDSRVWRVVDAVSKSGNGTLTFSVQKLLNQGRMTKRADDIKGR